MAVLEESKPQVTILYHYFHPDDVVSARHLSDLAEGLAERGWNVLARPSHRGCRDESIVYAKNEHWNGVTIRRVWRPKFKQASNLGRLANASWMIMQWSLCAISQKRYPHEVVIIGTDPVMSPLVAIPWRLFRWRSKIVYWCFDLYPEAAIADGMIGERSIAVRALKYLLTVAYGRCQLIVDIGSCMKRLLSYYSSPARTQTLIPWALVEPSQVAEPDPNVRNALFGDAKLGLLYSGTFGRAHRFQEFLELARLLRGSGVVFCFAGRGNRTEELRAAVTPEDTNIKFAGFAPEAELEKRLTACDLHLVSLREEWTGTVVPSKFFGALAVGRGVLFSGSLDSAIAGWIHQFELGFVLDRENLPAVASRLRELANDSNQLANMHRRCHRVYRDEFSKSHQLDQWDQQLRALLPDRKSGNLSSAVNINQASNKGSQSV